MEAVPNLSVLGTPLAITDYSALCRACVDWYGGHKPVAIEFANTQIVTMRRHEGWFREITSEYNGFIPDGMPLIWCLNLAGAKLRDRVYGPTFMRKFLETAPAGSTHYLLGGSEACGRKLRENFLRVNPDIRFVGAFHGRCSVDGLLGEDDQRVTDEINEIAPDCIWVGFGTPKQQAWLKRHKHLIRRGMILTVGFAFDVNAGMKPDAPAWMQRFGLTWVFRFCSEPRRLATRYLRYNSLFLFYLFWDGLRGRAFSK